MSYDDEMTRGDYEYLLSKAKEDFRDKIESLYHDILAIEDRGWPPTALLSYRVRLDQFFRMEFGKSIL